MATIVSMPKWGLAMKTGLIVEWLKHPGDAVQQGEPLVEIESEKATNEVDAPATGMLRWLEVAQGENAPVGAALNRWQRCFGRMPRSSDKRPSR